MADHSKKKIIDLSHVIEDGMVTYKGLPAPHICDFWTREGSADQYEDGSSFQIGRIDMVANTGTYLDSPYHRFAEGKDLAELSLSALADLPAILVHRPWEEGLATDASHLQGLDVRGKAVLVHSGWDRNWRTDAYSQNHPFLTSEAADWLAAHGAMLVGIDSHNIDDTSKRMRPVHSKLLGDDIPICEHLTGLASLVGRDFRFSAVPPKVRGMGSFPVRAYGVLC
jgi:kynurenine formamidase